MRHNLEKKIYEILNNWAENISPHKNIVVNFDVSKHKFRNLYSRKTGEFLKISQKLETQLFSKIVLELSKNNEVNEKLIDEYLDWCFENYEIIIKKYNVFNLQNIAKFSSLWKPNLFQPKEVKKICLDDLESINISENVFLNCEKYGVPLVSTKLAKEKNISARIAKALMIQKLTELTTDAIGLSKLRNMLRSTVENAPYFSELVMSDYRKELKTLFDKYKGEPWCKDVV
jgi:hypothetical protein